MSSRSAGIRIASRIARSPTAQVGFLLALAAVTRLYRLTYWPLEGDEFFTRQASLTMNVKGWPLLFALNHYLIQPWHALDALGLRLLPVLFGILSIPVLFWAGRKMMDTKAGLFAALLAVFNPWHLLLSQFARYYTLVFLFTTLSIVLLLEGYRKRRVAWLVGGLVLAALAALSHPSAALVTAAICCWAVADTVLRRIRGEPVSRFQAIIAVAVIAVGVAGVVYLLPILIHFSHVNAPSSGFPGPVLVLSFAQWMTAGTVLFALGGTVWMWRDGKRTTTSYLVAIIVLPMLFVSVGGYVFKATVPYLFATAPAVFLLAGYFVGSLARALEPHRVVGTAASAIVLLAGVATGLPSFLSQYMDGTRPDYRSAATYLARHASPRSDLVLSDMSGSLQFYLGPDSALEVRGFERTVGQLEESVRTVAGRSPAGQVWVTPWIRGRGGFNDTGLGAARDWLRVHCILMHVVARSRLDYRRNAVDIYRCPPSDSLASPSSRVADRPR